MAHLAEELSLTDAFPCLRTYMPQDSMFSYSTAPNVHRGQRKLLLSEVEFLTQVHDSRILSTRCDGSAPPPPLPRFVCVYAGAYPCTHLEHLLQMYPNVNWILIDPRFINDKKHHWDRNRVAIYAHKFDDATAQAISEWASGRKPHHAILPSLQGLNGTDKVGFENLLFLSDIRSDAYNEISIALDMACQQRWFRGLYASAGLLKFRLPYCDADWNARYQEHHGVVPYLDGTIYLPIWGRPSTSECRLHVKRGCGIKNYDVRQHEERMAGFESLDRQKPYVFNGDLFSSWDEAAEKSVMAAYLKCMKQYGYTVKL